MAPIKKIKSSRGATILLALVYMLVAAAVGTMVLTAAHSNLGRIRRDREGQSRYLAVASAIDLAKTQIREDSYQGACTETTVLTQTWTTETDEETGEEVAVYSESTVGPVKEIAGTRTAAQSQFLKGVKLEEIYNNYIYGPDRETQAPEKQELELSFDAGELDIPPVEGKLTVVETQNDSRGREIFTVELTLWAPEGAERHYQTVMTIPAVVTEEVLPPEVTVNENGDSTITTTVITHTHTVKWSGTPRIVKEVTP